MTGASGRTITCDYSYFYVKSVEPTLYGLKCEQCLEPTYTLLTPSAMSCMKTIANCVEYWWSATAPYSRKCTTCVEGKEPSDSGYSCLTTYASTVRLPKENPSSKPTNNATPSSFPYLAVFGVAGVVAAAVAMASYYVYRSRQTAPVVETVSAC